TRDRLAALGSEHGASMFMVLQTAVAVLLHREGAGEDIALGTPVSGRNDPALDDLIGFFVGTQVLRTPVPVRSSFTDLVGGVRDVDLAAFDNQDVGFQQVVERLAPPRVTGRNPLFQVSISYLPLGSAPGDFLGVPATFAPLSSVQAKFDLGFTFVDAGAGGEVTVALEYAADLFDADTAQGLLDRFGRVLDAVALDPAVRIDRIELLDDAASSAVRAAEGSAVPSVDGQTVTALLRAAADRHADRPALIGTDGESYSYREVAAAADRIAAGLRGLGVTAESPVAVLMDRSPAQLVALQAVLRAGAPYLPVDADLPDERIAFILDDARPAAILIDAGRAVPVHGLPAVTVTAGDLRRSLDEPLAAIDVSVDAPAYLIYTSGSTGTPKGVTVTHRSVANVLAWRAETLPGGYGPGEVMLAKTPVGFDGAVWELLLPFVSGAAAVVAEPGAQRDPRRLAQIIAAHGVTGAVFVPSLLDLFVEHLPSLPTLRHLIAGGEALPAGLAERVAAASPSLSLINAYGPTETTVVVTDAAAETGLKTASVPIGVPVAGAELLVLDAGFARVPEGAVGELYVRGPVLARGYANRPGLTAASFVADPTGERPGGRVYRTGDLVRRRRGVLEYVGRADTQVKVRGNRVELGEIEAALLALPGVTGAAVAADADRLVGWVTVDADGGDHVPAELSATLAQTLPGYMVPSPITVLEQFPLNHTGKLDRRALPTPTAVSVDGTAPRTDLERQLAEIFGAVLGVEVHDVHAGFFDLGGHSLLAIKAINQIRSTLGYELGLRVLFDAPTVAGLAAHLDGQAPAAAVSGAPVLRARDAGEPAVLSYGQERMLILHGVTGPTATYNVPLLWRPGGPEGGEPIDGDAFAAALRDVVARHRVLSTRYPDQRPEVLPADGVAVVRAESADDLFAVAAHPFDLTVEAPLRAAVSSDLAVINIHHIATDEWSAAPLRADLDTAYRARLEGRAPEWTPLPLT
ncbi:MAG: amino acid adenylation domain-containing protein, partial [Gordonia sp. (in: high G+C Gram-positive bacteria)]